MKKNDHYNSLLDQIGKKQPFSVPENYFEKFPAELQKKVKSEPAGKPPVLKVLRPYISIAAGFLLVFALWQLVLQKLDYDNSPISQTPDSAGFSAYSLAGNEEDILIDFLVADSNFVAESPVEAPMAENSENTPQDSAKQADISAEEEMYLEEIALEEFEIYAASETTAETQQDLYVAESDELIEYLIEEDIEMELIVEHL